MKKYIFPIALTLVLSAVMISCQSDANKIDNAQQDVLDAQLKLEKAWKDSIADYNTTQAEWDAQIVSNEIAIAEYKEKIAKANQAQRVADEAKLTEMEQRNEEMKAQMKEYKSDGDVAWEVFKSNVKISVDKFNNDMTELGKSIEKLGTPASKK